MKAIVGLSALVVFACVGACATSNEPDGGFGTGGTGAGVGGTGAGVGGTVAGVGGTVAGAGGTVAGAGGSTAGQVDSTFATDGYGTSGAWSGYLFTANDAMTTVSPACPTPCFVGAGAKLCASGSVGATYGSFAMIGYNVNQNVSGTAPATWTTTGTGISVNVSNPGQTPMRIKVTVGTTDYCTDLSTAGGAQTKVWADFKTMCWGTAGVVLPAGSAITSVALQVPGTEAAATPYNFCVVNLAPM